MWKSQQYVSGWGQGCVQWVRVGCQVGGVWGVSNGVEQDKTVSRVPNH